MSPTTITPSSRAAAAEAAAKVLDATVEQGPGVPGVVAGLTDAQETFFLEARGQRDLESGAPMEEDQVFSIFSTTKAIAGTAALQLYEQGRLDLDAPAKDYVPEIGEIQVLEGFGADGAPQLRPPARDITTRHLLLHTAGFGYDFFNADYERLTSQHGYQSPFSGTKESLMTPLLFDPGERWEYGSNIDWVGQVVEAVAGTSLEEYMAENIFSPLGMSSTSFLLNSLGRDRLARMHHRLEDGTLEAGDFVLPEPEVHMGGHGLYSTVGDYLRFIRMWLNDGAADSGEPVLSPETVRYAEQNHLGDLKIKGLPGVKPELSNDAEFFPGEPKSWALTFMYNDQTAPTGRPAGSLAWAGLANLYYWIDRKTGIGGYWATQILPFVDPGSVGGYLQWETEVYSALTR
ncbi:serine hydrolase domain-containing protein [Nesterenkonia massiliensis]|uniref:serine hydrolase domain-containing protein n=1 Tax=Nesterenkonia massiliensis TaxID=1232429 RepID=UPI000415EFB4|nr:serine hydrolase domain-containing protein [Nesterenkonia massiliensis]